MNAKIQTTISPDGHWVTLKPLIPELRFHALWLRDNAELARNPLAQKKTTVLDLPAETTVQRASMVGENLQVVLQPGSLGAEFPLAWLQQHATYDVSSAASTRIKPAQTLWDSSLSGAIPVAEYRAIRDQPAALEDWLQAVAQFGVARLSGLSGRSEELLEVADLFGYVRSTNYGRYFNVRTKVDPENLAYTSLALQPHTDNPYRDPVPTLQILYCVENSADGGDSIVVDGFQAALQLEAENPRHFELLSRFDARFRYRAHGKVDLSASKPILRLSPTGQIIGIHFNNRSMAPLQDVPSDQLTDYYAAYRHLAGIIGSAALAVAFRLHPGELFIVDNTRVLHGRTGYASTGNRWLQGCYPDKDGLLSTLSVLRSNRLQARATNDH